METNLVFESNIAGFPVAGSTSNNTRRLSRNY